MVEESERLILPSGRALRQQFDGRQRAPLLQLLLSFALSVSVVQSVPASDMAVAVDWTLRTPEGREVRLSDEARRQTTVLFFWATWCPYCKALMPHLQSMKLEHGEDLTILAINMVEDGDPVQFIRKAGYDFLLLLDGDGVAESYRIAGTPGVLVVDGDRVIRFDLRSLPPLPAKSSAEPASHGVKAAHRAPYWAAEIRKAVDSVQAARDRGD